MSINRNKKENANIQESILKEWMIELIDDVTCGLCFEIHRATKMGTLFLNEGDADTQKKYEIVDKKGLDVFGQVPTKKQVDCVCPSCERTLAASRFAPHLEKCLGMGRIRKASKRIATNKSKQSSDHESETDNEKYDDTDNYLPDRKTRKKEKHKKKHRHIGMKPSSICGSTSSVRSPSSSITNVEDLSGEV